MRKLLKRICLFILPILIIAYPLDWFITSGLKKSKSFSTGKAAVWADIMDGNIHSDCIVLGSSRATQHIDPTIIEDETKVATYNLGTDAHNVNMDLFKFDQLLKYNDGPRYIIYSVDAFTLEKRPDLYGRDQFLPFIFQNKDMEEMSEKYEGFTWADFHLPLVRYIGQAKAIKEGTEEHFSSSPSLRYKGYMPTDKSWEDDLGKAKKRMASYEIAYDDQSIKMFEAFLSKCKENKISLALIYTPEYIEGQKFIANRDVLISRYTELAQKYELIFLDYSSDALSFDKKYFYNSSHLNKKGSVIFTKEMVEDLKYHNFFK